MTPLLEVSLLQLKATKNHTTALPLELCPLTQPHRWLPHWFVYTSLILLQMQTNEDGYSILKGAPKRSENMNIGPEYSKLEGTTQVTQHQVLLNNQKNLLTYCTGTR